MAASLDAHALGHLRLHFSEQEDADAPKSLSAVEQTGRSLWLGGDEGVSIKHLTTEDHASYFERESIPLTAFFHLPGGTEEEVDLEGLAIDPDTERLWVAGSHSWRRKRPKGGETAAQTLDALGKISRQANRYLLGSIEIKGMNDASKTPRLAERNAQALPFDEKSSSLIETLRDDARLAPFLDIPSKDNGFDIEGIAAKGGAVYVGLRGPVLRGWASILQIHPEASGKGGLRLKPIKGVGRSYLHHVLDLDGLGIRDLCVFEEDLLVLAGPTMALDGPIRVFRWRKAFGARQDRCLDNRDLQRLFDIPTGPRVDHAEGMALFKRSEGSPPRLLVVYDSPAQGRLHSGRYFEADLFKI